MDSILKQRHLFPGWNNATGVKSSLGLLLGIPNTVLFADTAYFQVSISPTLYKQLFPRAQKDTDDLTVFCAFGICLSKSCVNTCW
jgi:hypothetical protein